MRWEVLALVALGGLNAGCFLPFDTEPPEGPSLIYLLPEGFSGWSCTDFGVDGAPPLEQEGTSLVIRPRAGGEVLETSHTKKDLMFARTEGYFESGSQRRALPIQRLRSQSFQEDTDYPVARLCVFFGQEDDRSDVPEAPKLESLKRSKKSAA